MVLPPGPAVPADDRGRCRAWWGSVSRDKVEPAIYFHGHQSGAGLTRARPSLSLATMTRIPATCRRDHRSVALSGQYLLIGTVLGADLGPTLGAAVAGGGVAVLGTRGCTARPILRPLSSGSKTGQIARYKNRTDHESATTGLQCTCLCRHSVLRSVTFRCGIAPLPLRCVTI
jgi:hypothetical protein